MTDLNLKLLPPQNIDAEMMILGSMLIENESIKKVIGILSHEDFYKESHRKLYQVMIDMHRSNTEIDIITLPDFLQSRGILEAVGGSSFLAQLVSMVPTGANIKRYTNIVIEKSALRKLNMLAHEILGMVQESKLNANEISHQVIQSAKNSRTSSGISIVKYEQVIKAGMDHIEKRSISKKKVYGIPTGIVELDDHTDGIYPGESWLVAARPGKGKTAFATGVARHAASQGHKVGVINLEMGEEQIGIRSLSSKTGIPITMLRKGMIEEGHWPKLTSAWEQLSKLPIFTCSTAFTTEQIEHATDKLIDDYGCELIIYDYMQLIRPGRNTRDRNREQEVAEVSAMIKRKAMQAKFAALPLAQLNRETEKRKDKKPQLSDLRESGALEQDADNVILIYHYECACPWGVPCGCGNRDRVDFLIDKGRNSGTAVIQAVWDKFTTSFKSANEERKYQETYHDKY